MGAEVNGMPTSHPPTAAPQRRPARLAAHGQRDAMFLLSRKRRSRVSQDELVILIVVLIAWGFGTASIVLN
jgi:hypothetical protein